MRWLSVALVAGCASLTAADYVGVWNNTGGSQTTTCPGSAAQTASYQPNTFSVAISDGGNGTINLALPLGAADACVLNASVDFDATLKPSSCAVAGGTLAFSTGHLTLDDAHQTMHFVADATASTTTTCAQHYDVTLSR